MRTPESFIPLEKAATENAWRSLLKVLSLSGDLTANLGPWQTSTTPSGFLLSARVSGPDAQQAVLKFAAFDEVQVLSGGFQRAHLDYGQRGRVAVVWRSNGVWVELWCSDTAKGKAKTVAPAAAPQARMRRLLAGAGGRLPFTRKQPTRTDKEKTTT